MNGVFDWLSLTRVLPGCRLGVVTVRVRVGIMVRCCRVADWESFTSSSECSDYHTRGSGGELTSPRYPRPYPSHVECAWMIRVEYDQDILINVMHLDMGQSGQHALPRTATHGHARPRIITHSHTLPRTSTWDRAVSTHCHARPRTATHGRALSHTATHCHAPRLRTELSARTATHGHALPRTTAHDHALSCTSTWNRAVSTHWHALSRTGTHYHTRPRTDTNGHALTRTSTWDRATSTHFHDRHTSMF